MRHWLMTIKDGKFWKDNKEVPIEHGNKEQIALLAKVNEMQTDGIYPEIAITQKVSMQFECICGATNDFDEFDDIDIDDDPGSMLRGSVEKCHNCGVTYKVCTDENGDMMLKLIPKKK